ncbi:MAG: hypothetical protein IJ759_04045 [Bacteroidales bacterium]|nr:hypothetical protein [Bacteroidales bacterium]
MKTTKIMLFTLLSVLFLQANAQNSVFQTIDTEINHIKIENGFHKTQINVDSSRVKDTVYVTTAQVSGLFSVISDTLIVENKKVSEQSDINIVILLKNIPKSVTASNNSDIVMTNNQRSSSFSLIAKDNSHFKLDNMQPFVTDTLIVKMNGKSTCIMTDSIAVYRHLDIDVCDSAVFHCGRYAFPSEYCRLSQKGGEIFLDNNLLESNIDLGRHQNSLPSGFDAAQFYWKVSANAGLVTPKSDFWGQGTAFDANFDFLLQFNFAYQNAVIVGWGFGYKYLGFKADGYTDGLNITNRENQTLSRSCSTLRLPILYRRYLDDNINAPSVDIGLIPYWINRPSWHMKYSESIDDKPLSKSYVMFEDLSKKFQLDAYLGLNLGKKFSIYTQVNLLPILDKSKTDEIRSINIGVSYKIDFMKWNF